MSSPTNNPDVPRTKPARPSSDFRALPAGIWTLGFVSLLMDSSSEMVHGLLPVFMAGTLGASMVTIGVIEGVAEAAAAIVKVFSGAISDLLGKRKPLAVLGYGLAAVTKPVFPLATGIGWVFGARFIDRLGKGIRGAPRDALVADIVSPDLRGAAYGLRQALDSVGAFIGPLLAVLFMAWFAGNIRAVLWVAVIPAFMAVGLLDFGIHEPEKKRADSGPTKRFTLAGARLLPARYWLIVALGALLALARVGEAFLVLRAKSVGLALIYVPTIMIAMNVIYAAASYPAGVIADRAGPRLLLAGGVAVLAAAHVLLALAASPLLAFAGAALWGLHMGLTQGLFAKLIADAAPAALRGTAFGVFNLVAGAALLPAGAIAGALWTLVGAQATFMAGAAFAAIAGLGLSLYRKSPQ